ncbi:hypothetical protein AGMMS49936_11790 [Endomicrobiia bacterium]|nr:hypothetical protein AGMMS49936_11790 [Endomicrobiia bacterium]
MKKTAALTCWHCFDFGVENIKNPYLSKNRKNCQNTKNHELSHENIRKFLIP